MSDHYYYAEKLAELWLKAVNRYGEGKRGADAYFTDSEEALLASVGIGPQELYDFAEDFVNYGEPGLATFVAIHDVRRRYFLEVQGGVLSDKQTPSDSLPPKTAEVAGIVWLPRLIAKAKAKLLGEMNPDLMYGCAGDRNFLKQYNIHPAEFLVVVQQYWQDEQAVVDWVVGRQSEVST